MNDLPPCRHRGRELRRGFVECFSDRLIHNTRDGLAPLATCRHPCPYADRPNKRSGLGDWLAWLIRFVTAGRLRQSAGCGCASRRGKLNRWWRRVNGR